MVEFLKEEIKIEKEGEKSQGDLPRLKGFDVAVDGAEVVFTKKSDNET